MNLPIICGTSKLRTFEAFPTGIHAKTVRLGQHTTWVSFPRTASDSDVRTMYEIPWSSIVKFAIAVVVTVCLLHRQKRSEAGFPDSAQMQFCRCPSGSSSSFPRLIGPCIIIWSSQISNIFSQAFHVKLEKPIYSKGFFVCFCPQHDAFTVVLEL